LLTFNVPEGRTPEQARLMVQRIEEEALRLPGVRAVGVTSNVHLNMLSTQTITLNVEGVEPPPGQDYFQVDNARVDAGYFDAAGIPIVRGRNFDAAFDREDAARVAIVNQTMAERFWPGQDPIGRTFTIDTVRFTIVGVARDAKYRTLGEPPRPFVYTPYSQRYASSLTILARTAADADGTAARLLALVRSLEPELMVLETRTMERHLAIMLLPARPPGRTGLHGVRRAGARARTARRVRRRELRGGAPHARGRVLHVRRRRPGRRRAAAHAPRPRAGRRGRRDRRAGRAARRARAPGHPLRRRADRPGHVPGRARAAGRRRRRGRVRAGAPRRADRPGARADRRLARASRNRGVGPPRGYALPIAALPPRPVRFTPSRTATATPQGGPP